MFARLRGPRRDDSKAYALYGAIVSQARQPALYADYGVPDTVAGRFEMIVLHSVLLFHRLKSDGAAGEALTQEVFDLFTSDMDQSLREMGVGDFGVPKRMKAMGKSFYGRLASYGTAIVAADRPALAAALQRNLFPDGPDGRGMLPLARYALGAAEALKRLTLPTIAAGSLPHAAETMLSP